MKRSMLILLLLSSIGFAQSPGELVGWTQYEHQDNTGGTNRAIIDSLGGVHVCWTNGLSGNFPRYIYYNYRDPQGTWFYPLGTQVSENYGGFCDIALGPNGCYSIFYHVLREIHMGTSCGGYNDYAIADTGYWAKGAISPNGRFHVLYGYYRSLSDRIIVKYRTSSDNGQTWTRADVDTTYSILWTIGTSRVSNRTATAIGMPIDTLDSSAWNNDIAFINSTNGVDWDFRNVHRITNYEITPLRAGRDCDMLIDRNDYLHIVWNTSFQPFNQNDSRLWHWSEETGQTTQIAEFGPTDHQIPSNDMVSIAKMSLGMDANNNIFCVWTGYTSGDASNISYCNGDLYMAYSIDSGSSWSLPQDITNTHTPNCAAGNCESEGWATLAEQVDTLLHILYIEDKDAGSSAMFEGEITDNPVRFLEIPNPITTGISVDHNVPRNFEMLQSFPNPFNSKTVLQFSLDSRSDIRLNIFDITGRQISSLYNGVLDQGKHHITWNADNLPSGIYFARLKAENRSACAKLLLLK